jgi:hypothetical protein
MRKLFYLMSVSVVFVLCSAKFIQPTQLLKTKLHITVRNELGNLVEGAKVALYSNKTDYEASKNQMLSKNTNEKGIAVFSDLEEKVYFVNVEKGAANNFDAATQTDTLKSSRVNKVTIIISE